MRKIYDEYLYVPEQGEGVVREKVFFSRLVLSIACMVVCMIAMGYNAYAFFTANVESTANTLQAATYSFVEPGKGDKDLIVQVETGGSVTNEGTWKYTFGPGTYDLILVKSSNANASTGYGRIDVFKGDVVEKSIFTKQIGKVDEAGNEKNERIVRIKIKETTVIQVVACWGTYSDSNNALDETEQMIEVNTDAVASVVDWKSPTSETSANVAAPAVLTNNEETTQQGVAPTNSTTVTETPVTGLEEKKDESASQEQQTDSSQQQGEAQQQEESQKTDSDSVEGEPSTTQ